MYSTSITKLSALLFLSATALANPVSSPAVDPTYKIKESFPLVPFTPAQKGRNYTDYDICLGQQAHGTDLTYPTPFLDCLGIGTWADDHNGEWNIDPVSKEEKNSSSNSTTDDDEDDWQVVKVHNLCALLVKTSAPTTIGNGDVFKLITSLYHGAGVEDGSVEQKGKFLGCQANVDVHWWLRNSEFTILPAKKDDEGYYRLG